MHDPLYNFTPHRDEDHVDQLDHVMVLCEYDMNIMNSSTPLKSIKASVIAVPPVDFQDMLSLLKTDARDTFHERWKCVDLIEFK